MIPFSDFIKKTREELEVSDAGYSQKEIEELLNAIETNAQDAFLSDDTSKREKRNAVETIRWIRTIRPKFDSSGPLPPDLWTRSPEISM